MAPIAIVSPNITTGDAVGNDVLGMYRVLTARGHTVRLYADYWDIPEPSVYTVNQLPRFLKGRSGILLYHHAIGWDLAPALLKKIHCRKIVRYHNVTPGHFFDAFDPKSAKLCRKGRDQLKALASCGCDLYLADSGYNQGELIAAGAEPSRSVVVPPFHCIDRLQGIEPDKLVLETCRDGRTNVLCVGRIAPNKGFAALIDAFAVYHHHYNPRSRLLLVGKQDQCLGAYVALLQQQVAGRGLQNVVVFAGKATEAALKAYYLVADVFMIASEHEGFCVPLVEAMALKLPIVAHGSTAIPETVGTAGFVWEEADPFLMAGSVACITQDQTIRRDLGARGCSRYEQKFTTKRIEAAFLDACRVVC
jgi:glycosyltransferase involved in cell wall biosynthesis